jgi:PleD family two-component response regulator
VDPGRVRVAVSDSGKGIDPDILPELFKAFATTKENGMGMGLAIAARAAKSWVARLARVRTRRRRHARIDAAGGELQRGLTASDDAQMALTIAVIDDDASARTALARLTKTAAIEVKSFGSAGEFLCDPRTDALDCVVSDLRMPEIDGLHLQEEICRQNPDLSL